MTATEIDNNAAAEAADIQAAQEGDRQAFDRISRHYQGPIVRYCARLVPDEAEDMAQDTFVNAYNGLHTFQYNQSFSAWLYRIARNACLEHLRLQRVKIFRNAAEFSDDAMQEAGGAGGEQQEARYEQAENKLYAEQVYKCLEKKTRPQDRVIALYCIRDKCTWKEIAARLNIPLGTVYERYRKHILPILLRCADE